MLRTTTVAVVLTLFASALPSSAAVSFSTFTDPHPTMGPGTIGFTFAGNKFVGTVLQNGTGSLYSTDLTGGNVQVFAPTASLNSSSGEHFVAASFNAGGFTGGEVYAADGSNIVRIANNGTVINNSFVTGLTGEVRGITFDLFGTFGNAMLVTTSAGNVYKIGSGGSVGLLANVGEDVEGLDIAPVGGNFGTFGGQLFVCSEGSGNIRAVSAGGVVTLLSNGGLGPVNVASAEELTFVPLNVGITGSPLEGLYGANYTPNVQFAAASQFTGMAGDMIVTGETTGLVSAIHWDGTKFITTQIGAFPNQPEDGIFVTPAMVPEPSTFGMLALIGLTVLRRKSR